jgi:hypothetical protein
MSGVPQVIGSLLKAASLISERGIAKSQRNESQGFNFRGIDAVYNELSPILVECNLVCVPNVIKRETQERVTRKERNGFINESVLMFETVTTEYTVYSSVDGSSVKGIGIGQAMDSGDKALNKAQSAAFKYFWFQLLCIPTEGNNDADATTHSDIQPQRDAPPAAPDGVEQAKSVLASAQSYEDFLHSWQQIPAEIRTYIAVHDQGFMVAQKARFGK